MPGKPSDSVITHGHLFCFEKLFLPPQEVCSLVLASTLAGSRQHFESDLGD